MNVTAVQRIDRSGLSAIFRDISVCAGILAACSGIGLLFYFLGLSEANIITIYILGILVISSLTTRRLFGIISSVTGVLLFNCLYAEPRFTLLVFDPQYSITAMIMLAASLFTSYFTSLFRHHERVANQAESERLRVNLLRSISHDIRTPLTSIIGNADILLTREDKIGPESRRRMYQDICDDSNWLIGMVENLLFITRMEDGVMPVRTEPEVLQEVVEEAVGLIGKRVKKHRILVDMSDELLVAQIDARLFMQVIINLTDNAVKHTPPGSEIRVTAYRSGHRAVVEIADTGPGISDREKSRAFEMFYTTGGGSGDARRGIGLGLPLCRAIVTAHGGTIRISDNTPSGVVVTITIETEEVRLGSQHTGN